jgi:predicted metalloprotease with PDZ domain
MSNKNQIKYTISMEAPHTHIFNVKIEVDGHIGNHIDFKMPVWTPGSYLVREFAKNIISVSASNKNSNLEVDKISKNTWRVVLTDVSKMEFSYQVYAYEKTVRTSYLDGEQAMINGASVFMIPEGYENQPLELTVEPYHQWQRITTTLDSYKGSYDKFVARNFDDLIDCPIEVGNHQIHSFEAGGATHEYAITSTGNVDVPTLLDDSKKIVDEIHAMFGDTPPYEHYVFFLHLTSGGFGGLEHCKSCSMIYDRNGFKDRKKYIRLLSLVSHEFFHTWNIKRIRPEELGPFDYYNEVYTNLLWIAEGVTSYYDNLFLPRCGVSTIKEYFETICDDIKRYEAIPGKDVMTVEESSFDAWVKLYRSNENSVNTSISYYLKGGLIIMALDLTIRDLTDGQKSMDAVYRILWDKFNDDGKGINDTTFKSVCENVAGKPLNGIWNYLSSTAPLKIENYFEPFGILLKSEHSKAEREKSGWFGVNIKKNSTAISTTLSTGSGYTSGLYVHDEILAINGQRITSDNVKNYMENISVNELADFLISRDGLIKTISVKAQSIPFDKYSIEQIEKPTARQKQMFEGWLKQDWDA